MITLIAAMTRSRVIGKNNGLPWHLPEDLKRFKRLTTGHPIVMGRSTYKSIGKPLPNRTNIVLSSSLEEQEGIVVCRSLQEALDAAQRVDKDIFIIGGASVYKQALPFADRLCLSWVVEDVKGDTYFPEVDWIEWKETFSEDCEGFVYKEYIKNA